MTSQKINKKIWLSTATGIWLLLLLAQPQIAVAQWTPNGNHISNTNSGNVGIGTTTPTAKLEVVGSALFGGHAQLKTPTPFFALFDTSGTPDQRQFYFWNASDRVMGRWVNDANSAVVAESVTFRNNGFMGIGTIFPTHQLDVAGIIRSSTGGFKFPDGTVQVTAAGPGGAVISVFGRTGAVVAANNDYTWAQINKTTSTLADLTTRSAGDLSSGTLPDARFPATLPAASGVNLTALNASNLASGTVATARLGSGTANSTTFLRGDNTWVVPSGGSQWTTSGNNVYYNTGNVGIGTDSPLTKLQVAGGTRVDGTNGRVYLGTGAVTNHRGLEIIEENATTFSIRHHDPNVAWQNIAINPHGGNVGIGTLSPTVKLHVVGDSKVTGNLTVDGNIAAKYQDVAEWVPASERISAGTVVVLDATKSNHVIASKQVYDTRVAGVISDKPGIALGERGDNKVLVATTGRVRIKVDATRGPIHIGDLLVTSDISGMAMKSEPINIGGAQIHRPGTLIGKALEPLAKGQGEILVLLSLQ